MICPGEYLCCLRPHSASKVAMAAPALRCRRGRGLRQRRVAGGRAAVPGVLHGGGRLGGRHAVALRQRHGAAHGLQVWAPGAEVAGLSPDPKDDADAGMFRERRGGMLRSAPVRQGHDVEQSSVAASWCASQLASVLLYRWVQHKRLDLHMCACRGSANRICDTTRA